MLTRASVQNDVFDAGDPREANLRVHVGEGVMSFLWTNVAFVVRADSGCAVRFLRGSSALLFARRDDGNSLEILELDYVRQVYRNFGDDTKRRRIWVQGRFRKPTSYEPAGGDKGARRMAISVRLRMRCGISWKAQPSNGTITTDPFR